LAKTVPADVKVEMILVPTVKREVLDKYRKENGIGDQD
jgi:hypothetical protein